MGFQFDLFQVEDKKFGAFDKVNIEKAAIITWLKNIIFHCCNKTLGKFTNLHTDLYRID